MTALAGCIASTGDTVSLCASILQAQRVYGGGNPATTTLGEAGFGIDLHPTLLEDKFDRQPLVAAGRFLLVADVRLDNRDDLLAKLGIDGSGKADSDLLLAAWERWQDRCLPWLIGDFAFAVWDRDQRLLTLVRDPIGQRPLFYAREQDWAAFASTPSALLAVTEQASPFDFAQLAAMLLGQETTGDGTYFEQIRRVRPGHIVTIGPEGSSSRRYWWPPQDELRLTDDGFVEAYKDQLREAVGARLRRKTGLVAVHLSSGFDSSAVAATAALLATDPKPLAFTSAPRAGFAGPVPRGRIADESSLAALTAQRHGLEQIVVRPSSGVLSAVREHCRFYQDPNCNLVNMEWLREVLGTARERGVSTLLTGELGNLTLNAGGLPVLAEWLRRGSVGSWWREARAAVGSGQARWRGALINSFGSVLPEAVRGVLERRFLGIPPDDDLSFVRKEWAGAASVARRGGADDRYSGRYGSRYELIAAYDLGLFRKGSLGQFGIDERDPTADRRLVDFSFALPPEQLLHDGVWRPLARRALADLLPAQILSSPVRGYQGADWYERIDQEQALELLEEIASSHAVNELLDIGKMRSAIERWPRSGWAEPGHILVYRTRLPIAIATGVFLQLFESSIGGASAS